MIEYQSRVCRAEARPKDRVFHRFSDPIRAISDGPRQCSERQNRPLPNKLVCGLQFISTEKNIYLQVVCLTACFINVSLIY